jgi:DNA end-binding protein Ku
MPRALWKGVLTFGLVSIPVELFPAEDRKQFKFSMLDKRDFSPVGYKRYSKKTSKEVEWKNVVKGYEYEADQYVVLSDEDFKRANVKASQTVEIQSFVAESDIAPEFFDTPYYLVPGKNGDKVYALLRETLRSTKRMAVAQFVLRSTQHLAAIRVSGRALILLTLRYSSELRKTSEFDFPAEKMAAARITTKEVGLAKRLIDDMSAKWNPDKFKDTYHNDLMKRIKDKIKKGQTREITQPSDEGVSAPRPGNVIDLTALLKRSIEGDGERTSRKVRRPKSGSTPKLKLVKHPSAAKRKRA